MAKKVEIEKISWLKYITFIDILHEKIDWNKEQFKSLISINRGGNIIATILSHKTGIPLTVLNKGGIIYEREKFLVIDDCVDSGSTLENIEYLAQGKRLEYHPLAYANKDFKIAVLHKKANTKVQPDYFVEETNRWIVYPYEVEKV